MKRICRAGIYNDSKHLLNSTYRRAHTQSHTNRKETPEFLLDPPADERDEMGVRVRMGTCGSSKVPAARVGLVAAAAWSNRSSGAEIRVADGTHQGSTNRLVHSLSSPTTVNQLVTTQVLQISQRQRQRQPSLLGDIHLLPHGEGP